LANGLVDCFSAGPVIFSGMLQTRDIKEEWSAGFPVSAGGFVSHRIGRRAKSLVVQAVVNDAHAIARHVEETENIAGGISANGDNGVLSLRETLDDNAAIKHSERIVLSHDVKRREIVDGGDHCARSRVEQAAIAGDMQHVQAPFACEARQDSLVPQNVGDGLSKTFGHADEFESAVEFSEERQIALENEGSKAKAVSRSEQGAQQGKDVLADAGLPPLNDGGGNSNVH
jgi:hypothetical protein